MPPLGGLALLVGELVSGTDWGGWMCSFDNSYLGVLDFFITRPVEEGVNTYSYSEQAYRAVWDQFLLITLAFAVRAALVKIRLVRVVRVCVRVVLAVLPLAWEDERAMGHVPRRSLVRAGLIRAFAEVRRRWGERGARPTSAVVAGSGRH